MPELLLFSNSTNHASPYLGHALKDIAALLDGVPEVLFVPFAGSDHDAYTRQVSEALAPLGITARGLHTATATPDSARETVESAEAIFVGGGNTFRLVKALQDLALLDPIHNAVLAGTRYMGASAGTNIAAPTLRTTNDMPIVEPSSFRTLALVPFQINPHYIDADPTSTHNGETREQRLAEFHEENDIDVLGLREGTHLRVSGSPVSGSPVSGSSVSGSSVSGSTFTATVGGQAVSPLAPGPALLFRRGSAPREVSGDVRELFERRAR
jgi:dipeptidase E